MKREGSRGSSSEKWECVGGKLDKEDKKKVGGVKEAVEGPRQQATGETKTALGGHGADEGKERSGDKTEERWEHENRVFGFRSVHHLSRHREIVYIIVRALVLWCKRAVQKKKKHLVSFYATVVDCSYILACRSFLLLSICLSVWRVYY